MHAAIDEDTQGAASALAPRAGGIRQRLRRLLAPPTIVLAYHRVVPEVGRDVNQLAVSSANFAAQLRWLRDFAHPVSAEQFVARVDTRAWPELAVDARPRVLITFDDGYADNVQFAMPELNRLGLHALLFVTTAAAGTAAPYWWDALERIVYDARGGEPADWPTPAGERLPADTPAREIYALWHSRLKTAPAAARQQQLVELASAVGGNSTDYSQARPATWPQLATWRDAGHALGAHTRTHPQLSACSDDEVHAEIVGAREDLQQHLGVQAECIAYPFGTRADFDLRAEREAAAAGFVCGFANWPGNVRWARSLWALPRFLMRDWPADEFARRFQTWCAV